MKKVFSVTALALVGMSMMTAAYAEEPERAVTLEAGADLVSSYIWRGQECGGFSVQPTATITWNRPGLSLNAWASAELFESGEDALNMTEFDLALSWSPIEALSIGVTDYYFFGDKYFGTWSFNRSSSHTLEANLSYDFGPVSLGWNTVLAGSDVNSKDERAYSTYVEVSAPWKLGGVEGSASVGACLWDDGFTTCEKGFKVCNVCLQANKELFKIPFYGQIISNPSTDKVYFVVGVTF